MTREEAANIITKYILDIWMEDGKSIKDVPNFKIALDIAIEALEQQPTDAVDRVTIKEYLESFGKVKTELSGVAVDRQAVLDVISELNAISFYEAQEDSKECYYEIRNAIKQLPPVTPQQNVGHWTEENPPMVERYPFCSECGFVNPFENALNYCPNCGAKMQRVEE